MGEPKMPTDIPKKPDDIVQVEPVLAKTEVFEGEGNKEQLAKFREELIALANRYPDLGDNVVRRIYGEVIDEINLQLDI